VSGSDQQVLQRDTTPTLRRYSVESQLELEKLLELAQEHNLDVWSATNSTADIYFPTNASFRVDAPFTESVIHTTPPVQADDTWHLNASFHDAYHPLDQVEQFVSSLSAQFPERVKIVPIGRSVEQRDIWAIKISSATSSLKRKKTMVIMGAQHAREWISISTALYLAHELVSNSSGSYSLSSLLDLYDFHIIPIANPDGYKYSWEVDRLWYKNRQILGPNAKCVGIDMNRNWGYKWKPYVWGNNASPCDHLFPGTRAFQAPETNDIANYVGTLPNLKVFLELRSYGQIIAMPFSFSCKRMPLDAEDLLEAALGAADASAKVHSTWYTTGSLCSTISRAHGNVVDWMYKRAGIKYSYAVLLRDTGTYGFIIPPEWIKPIGEETAKMVEYIANFV